MDRLGGPVALAAGASIVTGMVGAMLLPPLLKRLRFTDDATMGLAVGQAAHIVGTDALGRTQPGAARVSGLALALSGLATTLWLTLLWPWVKG
jgi:putative effector of murein hydrolase